MRKPNGLIMTGGLSSRMGRDKALIEYTPGIPQYIRASEMITPFCEKIYLSTGNESALKGNLLPDQNDLENIGPLAGIVSAMRTEPTPWLVLGTDYPLLEVTDIEKLIKERDPDRMATVYINAEGYIEPFIALYEVPVLPILEAEIKSGNTSLQNILRKFDCKYIYAEKAEHLKSFDTPEDFNSYQQIST